MNAGHDDLSMKQLPRSEWADVRGAAYWGAAISLIAHEINQPLASICTWR
jgi:hypothetical protein